MAKEKLQITMDSDLLRDVDEYCDSHYMNRSWMISQACLAVVNQQKVIDSIVLLSQSIKKCADNGYVDEATRIEMQNFETMANLFSRSSFK